MRIAVISNTSWSLYNFRLRLMQALIAAGHVVIGVSSPDEYTDKLIEAGIQHRAFPLLRGSMNPLRELRSIWTLHRVLHYEEVEVVLSYTPKGNIYGAMAAATNGLAMVPNVSGLGSLFIHPTPLTWLVKQLYRFTFGLAVQVFFQNEEDLRLFVRSGLVDAGKAVRIPGSGVDLARFEPVEPTANLSHQEKEGNDAGCESFVFLLVARLLWDKGVGEYVEAARRVRQKYPTAVFRMLGFLDVQNPSAIPRAQVEAWGKEGVVQYLGSTNDVLPYLRDVDCVVLPSYREGCPRSLLEAAAMSKPIITTDVPGCRDTIDDRVTGFLCKLRDAVDLADKMFRMIEMDPGRMHEMGLNGHKKIVREFDERIVINRYLDVVDRIANTSLVNSEDLTKY
jgi:glycosyltransferase involved in cell wall biosynthesis